MIFQDLTLLAFYWLCDPIGFSIDFFRYKVPGRRLGIKEDLASPISPCAEACFREHDARAENGLLNSMTISIVILACALGVSLLAASVWGINKNCKGF